jgi:hypothetical protein
LQAAAEASLANLEQGLTEFQALIDAKDKQLVPIKQRECLQYVGEIQEAMVKGFPFEVPAQYADRPLLKVSRGWGVGPYTSYTYLRESTARPWYPFAAYQTPQYHAI